MHVVITGGAGFLGSTLARSILDRGELRSASDAAEEVTRLTLVDRVSPPANLIRDARVRSLVADLSALPALNRETRELDNCTHFFHLAGAVSGDCERDFDLGMTANVQGGWDVLEMCRRMPGAPRFVFSSSLAAFGRWPGVPTLGTVTDESLPTPTSSYGTQKFMMEQLVADYSRKGFVDGRSVRLMTVAVRPGSPNGAASGFLSGMVREPANGLQARVPVAGDSRFALASPERTIEGLLCAAETDSTTWGPPLAVNLPALTVSVDQMAQAVETVLGASAAKLLVWERDPSVEAIVNAWPSQFESARARRLGLQPDSDFEAIVSQFLAGQQAR